MVSKMKLEHFVVYDNILDEIHFGHYGIKVKVPIALTKFNHFNFPHQMALHY